MTSRPTRYWYLSSMYIWIPLIYIQNVSKVIGSDQVKNFGVKKPTSEVFRLTWYSKGSLIWLASHAKCYQQIKKAKTLIIGGARQLYRANGYFCSKKTYLKLKYNRLKWFTCCNLEIFFCSPSLETEQLWCIKKTCWSYIEFIDSWQGEKNQLHRTSLSYNESFQIPVQFLPDWCLFRRI